VYNSSYHTVVLQYYLHLWMSRIAVSSNVFLIILKIFQKNRIMIQKEEDSAFILEADDRLKPQNSFLQSPTLVTNNIFANSATG